MITDQAEITRLILKRINDELRHHGHRIEKIEFNRNSQPSKRPWAVCKGTMGGVVARYRYLLGAERGARSMLGISKWN